MTPIPEPSERLSAAFSPYGIAVARAKSLSAIKDKVNQNII